MKTTLISALAVALFLTLPVFGGIAQVVPISFSTSGSGFVSGSITSDFVASDIQPFDSALGALSSFEFSWVLTLTGSATTDGDASDSNSEFISGNASGPFFIGSSIYAGNGGGSGDGSNIPNQPLSFSFQVNEDTLFQVADAGSSYNQFILDSVTGSDPFNADWAASYQFNDFSGLPWAAGVDGSLTVTYNFDAPEPSTLGLVSIVLLAGLALLRRRLA